MALKAVLESDRPVALLGGGAIGESVAARILALSGPVAAADGGAEFLLARGLMPAAVIGDMDSLPPARIASLAPGVLHRVAEQESTDFEKCLTRIAAPLVLGTGFLGARVDHMLAALSVLVRYAHRRCLLASEEDVLFLCPPELRLDRPVGERLSLYPLAPVSGRSEGLEWPIDGLDFAPDGRVGTSNRVSGPLRLSFDAPGMVAILPVEALEEVTQALLDCPAHWTESRPARG